MTLIKICGVSDPATASHAVQLGADFIGLVFEPRSHRYITPAQAAKVTQAVRSQSGQVVGVFTEHSPREISDIGDRVGLDWVQLHGESARAAASQLRYPKIFALAADKKTAIEPDVLADAGLDPQRDFLLVDGPNPGSGASFDWRNFHAPPSWRWFLAGGLDVNNVGRAIQALRPIGVDVSSGVEDGHRQKDLRLVREFIDAVKRSS